jgi:nucleotide-binding universal stress UspA family protein
LENFRKILYATTCRDEDLPALRQAISLARNNGAQLSALVYRPELPDNLAHQAKGYDDFLRTKTAQLIAEVSVELGYAEKVASIDVLTGDQMANLIIRQVIRGEFGLLIKAAEATESGQGYDPIDMALLKYCPTPVWLSRPISRHRDQLRVAVAVDPEADEETAEKLSLRLLQLARSLADNGDGELRIVSCWDYELEGFLRRNSWVCLPAEDVSSSVLRAGDLHRARLNGLLAKSGIAGKQTIHHLRGKPGDLIPHFVINQQIDVLVMGTVARTGIPGFLFGNTAENIVQKLRCSLLAVKPEWFVTPIRLDA